MIPLSGSEMVTVFVNTIDRTRSAVCRIKGSLRPISGISMRICLICVEIFAWNKYGGFGRATRTIGRELNRLGVEVYAVVPRREDQGEVEELDGITVYGFKPGNPLKSIALFKKINADIYHSQEPSFSTYLAQIAMPHRKHVITFRDTRTWHDWMLELKEHSLSKTQVAGNIVFEDNWLVKHAVRHADCVCAASKFLIKKARGKYGLEKDPIFLPTPVSVPDKIEKNTTPMVVYVARLDRRKRPETFLDLATEFPEVEFIAVGKSRDRKYDGYLRDKYTGIPNLKMTGFVDQFSNGLLSDVYEKSWILVNTASREGLPNSYLEAAAHKCAILSHVDPDGFARKFGHCAQDNDFKGGLRFLIEQNRWRKLGENGYAYIRSTFETNRAIDMHVKLYKSMLS